jgi:hypothetical protein
MTSIKRANEGKKNKSEGQTKTLKNKENRRKLGQREKNNLASAG